ncbi:MAG: efflux RND transporter periplasmic adaptor subunit [Candidatus Puniceispirillales bacterium]
MKLLVAIMILLGGFGGYNYLLATQEEIKPQPRRETVRNVETVTVDLADARPVYTAFGTVSAARTADLRFSVSGEVETVSDQFRNGLFVRKGEELAALDTELLVIARNEIREQIAAEKRNIASLETQLVLRQRQFDRISEMQAASVAPDARVDDASLALTVARNALDQSQSRLRQYQLSLKRAERNLRESTLTAPFDGMLSAVSVARGQVIGAANPLGVLTDLSSLEVSFVVPAEVYAASHTLVGQQVSITWKAGGRSVETVNGSIERAEGGVTAAEGGGRLYAVLPQPEEGRSAIPQGAFVEVRLPTLLVENVAIVPDVALFERDTVYVIEDGRAAPRKVDVISRSDGYLYLKGELRDGDIVITTRLPGLGKGVRVEAVSS